MSRVHVLAEGQTEETFLRDVLAPYLAANGVYLAVTIAKTKRVKDGPDFKGGITSYKQVRNDLLRLLGDTDARAVTTMIDYYGLPDDFPGRSSLPVNPDPYLRVAHVEEAFANDIDNRKFIPFLLLHEFEALMFVSPPVIAEAFPEFKAEARLQRIKDLFASPEEINDSPQSAPSKRLLQIFGDAYQKPLHGPLVTSAIGLDAIRRECRHFGIWLEKLESLRAAQ